MSSEEWIKYKAILITLCIILSVLIVAILFYIFPVFIKAIFGCVAVSMAVYVMYTLTKDMLKDEEQYKKDYERRKKREQEKINHWGV